MNNITLTTEGDKITTASNEDTTEQDDVNKVLKEPIIYANEGFDETKRKAGVNNEIESAKKHQVFTDVHIHDISPKNRHNLIQSRSFHREKGPEVRSRIFCKRLQ